MYSMFELEMQKEKAKCMKWHKKYNKSQI